MALAAMLSALEVVPLTLLTLDAWDCIRVSRTTCDVCGKAVAIPHKWTFAFLIAVGVWNFVGAGIFGFLINLPIVSYYKVGMILTPNHGHAAMMGVYGMLAMALMVFALRQVSSEAQWGAGEAAGPHLLLGTERRPGGDGRHESLPEGRAAALGRPGARVLARTQPGVLQPGASGNPGVAPPAGGRHLHRVGRGSGRDGRGADVSGDAATPARRWNVTGRQEVGTRTGQAVRTEEIAGRFLEC